MKRAIDDELVAELTLAGWSAQRIARMMYFSTRTVVRARVRAGVARPASRPFSAEELALIDEMLAAGWPRTKIARALGRYKDVLYKPAHRRAA